MDENFQFQKLTSLNAEKAFILTRFDQNYFKCIVYFCLITQEPSIITLNVFLKIQGIL